MRHGEASEYVLTPIGRDQLRKWYALQQSGEGEKYLCPFTDDQLSVLVNIGDGGAASTIVSAIVSYGVDQRTAGQIARMVARVLNELVTMHIIQPEEED